MFKYPFWILFFYYIIQIPQAFAQVNLANGLVAHYPFNGNANDISGNNQNGVLRNNIQLSTDRFGNLNSAYLFDGIDDYISVSDQNGLFSTPVFSLVIWFKTNTNNLQNLIGKRDFGVNNGAQYQFFINYAPFPGIGSNIVSDLNDCSAGIVSSTSYINTNENICIGRWYCAVITFDGTRHNIYINGQLKRSVLSGFSGMARCNSELRMGNWWGGDLLSFNGVMDDIRWYNRPLTMDEIAILSQGSGNGSFDNVDFSYRVNNTCTGRELAFEAMGTGASNIRWSFGDQSESTIPSPVHQYENNQLYQVQLIVGSGQGCADTISKYVDLRYVQSNVLLNGDTAICVGDSVRFRNIPVENSCLTVNGISSPVSNLPGYLYPTASASYLLKADLSLPNLVVNGDFEAGNRDFSSNYIFTTNRTDDGQYGISDNASDWYTGLNCLQCNDHTNGINGRMLIADGATKANQKVWNANILVTVNTEYRISFWAISYDDQDSPVLECFINDRKAGEWASLSGETGKWKQFSIIWNSGVNTNLNLSIIHAGITSTNKRFSLDDIKVMLHKLVTDSFSVIVGQGSFVAVSNDTAICTGQSVTLNATGGIDYTWTPVTGLSNPSISNPLANPLVTTWYKVTATGSSTCISTDSVLITVNALPAVNATEDTSTCPGVEVPLNASGGQTYQWTPIAGLSDPTSANTNANPANTTRYTVTSTDLNGCTASDSVTVTVNPSGAIINASADTITCLGTPVQLNANGAVNYKWTPATGLSDAGSANPIATPAVTTLYIVSDDGGSVCSLKDSVLVTVNPLPQLLTSDDVVTCNGLPVQISASGGVRYNWTPATGLSDPGIPNPFANPLATTVYKVEALGANNCIATDEVKVIVSAGAKIYVPNAFTPNGDGLNDCFGIKGAEGATLFELAVYNRFGERIFFTKDPLQCWDGKFKSNRQPIGTYAWYLRMQSPCGNVDQKGTISIVK